ncbi:hypothetical protein Phi13:2_gp114 [Cellulophaga phage phi13:2]|uniref:Uncharacterized protein n=1 Tax=Cellulophaga phage phi13:2 TaxID=1328030 RepID=S0A2B6_9CAUD|nr:hypothetical protein Phi13:2_gp114 [Cellulophaga phage phi13:2]AGO49724.1 hypothetical protein Phi13:2_gp114 [Cellulophaga phage phi13:2]
MKVLDKTMVEYVIEMENQKGYEVQSLSHQNSNRAKRYFDIAKYAKFLSQEIELEMFVPCKDGVPLNLVISTDYNPEFGMQKYPQECYEEDLREYEEAKEKVLFAGFMICDDSEYSYWITEHSTSTDLIFYKLKDRIDCFNDEINKIEDLIPYKLNLTKEI